MLLGDAGVGDTVRLDARIRGAVGQSIPPGEYVVQPSLHSTLVTIRDSGGRDIRAHRNTKVRSMSALFKIGNTLVQDGGGNGYCDLMTGKSYVVPSELVKEAVVADLLPGAVVNYRGEAYRVINPSTGEARAVSGGTKEIPPQTRAVLAIVGAGEVPKGSLTKTNMHKAAVSEPRPPEASVWVIGGPAEPQAVTVAFGDLEPGDTFVTPGGYVCRKTSRAGVVDLDSGVASLINPTNRFRKTTLADCKDGDEVEIAGRRATVVSLDGAVAYTSDLLSLSTPQKVPLARVVRIVARKRRSAPAAPLQPFEHVKVGTEQYVHLKGALYSATEERRDASGFSGEGVFAPVATSDTPVGTVLLSGHGDRYQVVAHGECIALESGAKFCYTPALYHVLPGSPAVASVGDVYKHEGKTYVVDGRGFMWPKGVEKPEKQPVAGTKVGEQAAAADTQSIPVGSVLLHVGPGSHFLLLWVVTRPGYCKPIEGGAELRISPNANYVLYSPPQTVRKGETLEIAGKRFVVTERTIPHQRPLKLWDVANQKEVPFKEGTAFKVI